MSGGGSKGAYQVGVITKLVELLEADEVTWDVVSGVSAGALNSGLVSKYKF